jgi:hypothetical protein
MAAELYGNHRRRSLLCVDLLISAKIEGSAHMFKGTGHHLMAVRTFLTMVAIMAILDETAFDIGGILSSCHCLAMDSTELVRE